MTISPAVRGKDSAGFSYEIEADGIGAKIDGELGVGEIGDAADFYADHFRILQLGSRRTKERARATPGSGASIRDSPMRKASNPAARRLTRSASVRGRIRRRRCSRRGSPRSARKKFRADGERLEVAIVDADDFRAGGEGAVEFLTGVDFDERLHLELAAESEEFA